jgi:hypothetical protein
MGLVISEFKGEIKKHLGHYLDEFEGVLVDEAVIQLRDKFRVLQLNLGEFTYFVLEADEGEYIIIPSYQQLLSLTTDLGSGAVLSALKARVSACAGNFAWRYGIGKYMIVQRGDAFFELPYVILRDSESD